ncbi:Holliday junction DNA helicase [Corynebacterium resistens DSM 45100]|uniref:Holliday junction branch migration complex subunit RuvA n=1 Tax=Corynebacterium resistens (strain DSM 45100 / JCM 12819 / GTC 2026 / SICGH 158) TaxID=662755 RepID=F8E331_CORRG|nr:Holliday junction branch migration protein RuvA [Corynebacterium resistens]AEI09491.1 Holliday junction DNA helicase [Corynebacterium resistens DSM 45100]
MIASLRGTVIDKGLDYVVVECSGVGYHCHTTPAIVGTLERGTEAFVLTTLVVREDAQTLYAFTDSDQRQTFLALQKVSGVGARVALAIMSVLTPAELAAAVAEGDAKTLQRAPGVGKRLAERMVVDLKGKLGALSSEVSTPGAPSPDSPQGLSDSVREQVEEALVGLGFTEAKAASTVSQAVARTEDAGLLDASSLLRAALAQIGGSK